MCTYVTLLTIFIENKIYLMYINIPDKSKCVYVLKIKFENILIAIIRTKSIGVKKTDAWNCMFEPL